MAGLYTRVSGRGFPSAVAAGQTGAGALDSQGSTVDPAHGQAVTDNAVSTIGPYDPSTVAPLGGQVILEGAFGLGGSYDPDQVPQGHASPVPGFAGSYDDPALLIVRENSTAIHSQDFGGSATRPRTIVHGALGQEPDYDQWTNLNVGDNNLQKLDGQIRAMGGYDTTQGYDRRNGHGFDAGHRDRIVAQVSVPMAYLDPAERVFIVPQASGSFTPTDEYQGPQPWAAGWDAGAVNATPPTAYSPQPELPTAPAAPAGAPASSGWW